MRVVPVWSGSYSTGEGRALREQPTHLTEQSLPWLTPPCPSSSPGRHSRTLVAVLPSETSCIWGGSSGREMAGIVAAHVLRLGRAAMAVDVDSGERGGGQRRRWGGEQR